MKLRKDVAVSEAGLVFNPTTGESFSVNPIGVEILNLMREGKKSDAICAVITVQHGQRHLRKGFPGLHRRTQTA
jgi:hypothetical protein